MGLCMVIFLTCSGLLLKLLWLDPFLANKSNSEVKDIFYSESVSFEDKFKSLLAINSDIKGWVFISGTRIDYPVVQKQDDSHFYLSHNYKKEVSRYGSIFVDSACKNSTDSKNIILHGHHMNDGQMFADILKFSDLNFYKQNPIIEFDTPKEQASWKIFSVFKTNTLPEHGKIFNYMVPEFNSPESYMKFIDDLKKRSLISTPVDVNENDQILTLSTCSYEFKNFRTVVVARKVRQGESLEIDLNNAIKSPNPLMPDCWYNRS